MRGKGTSCRYLKGWPAHSMPLLVCLCANFDTGNMQKRLTAFCIFLMLITSIPAYAASENGVRSISIISDASRTMESPDFALTALVIELNPGWKTYWKHPGQFGLPLSMALQKTENIRQIDILWPVPSRFTNTSMPELSVIGYADTVTLPIKIWRKASGRKSNFSAEISLGICSDVCILHEAGIEYSEETSRNHFQGGAEILTAALKGLPRDNPIRNGNPRILDVAADEDNEGVLIAVCDRLENSQPWDLFISTEDSVSFSSPPREVNRNGDTRIIGLDIDMNFSSGTKWPAPIGTFLEIVYRSGSDAITARLMLKASLRTDLSC